MNLQKIALKKGKEVAAHNIQSWTRRTRYDGSCIEHESRYYATDNGPKDQLKGGPALVKGDIATSQNKHQHQQRYKSIDRDFFLSVLGSSATKRDARSYLKTFTPAPNAKPPSQKPAPSLANINPQGYGVNLGEFYGRTRAVANSPKFVQPSGKEETKAIEPPLHVALVKIRDPQNLDDNTLSGIGRTLSQLGHLGLTSVVVVDCNDTTLPLDRQNQGWRDLATQQADRVVAAIDAHGRPGARLVDNIIGVSESDVLESTWLKGRTHVSYRKLLMTPLRRGLIPVLPCIGYTETTPTAISLEANDVVLALTRELTGLRPSLKPDEDPIKFHEQLQALQNEVSVDRLIVIDPLGGVPASERPNGYHVFLNMEQEFQSAKQDLLRLSKLAKDNSQAESQTRGESLSDLASSSPLSGFVEAEFGNVQQSNKSGETAVGNQLSREYNHHLDNLELVRKVLTILPRTSSALLTTPDEAANSGRIADRPFQATGVGTRRQRNPLIHNLLTDKPAFSSSLPVGRLGPSTQSMKQEPHPLAKSITPTTFAKHGMSISIYPDPNLSPWEPPTPGISPLSLTDSQIDLPRLVHLIEDSFDRKLDVEHFLKRVNGRIAGVIIAGEYEGGALLTWELPPGVPDDGSPESRARMVPYLDKFAVLKRSQGSGGVADIVFTAMVRDCFPNGVCWRSRKNNPVNKWYFERSRGTWKLADSNWAMFWTTSNLDLSKQMFLDYEGVCRGVVPSWADTKAVAD